MSNSASRRLKNKADRFPPLPGIYFFKDTDDRIIYIGKARSLKNRIRSYFQSTADYKVRNILSETADIDFLQTDSEKEAALLENNFIRQYQPKFNFRLKDDKHFPYLKVTMQEPFPGIYLTRRVEEDGARYFGPFSPARQARETIHLITKFFGIRSCREDVPGRRSRSCLEHDLGLCTGPCVKLINKQDYWERVQHALLFLEGKVETLRDEIRKKMERAAQDEEYEQAALWRDLIKALEQVKLKPKMISVRQEDLDIVGFARSENMVAFYVFMMRNGLVSESTHAFLPNATGQSDARILSDRLLGFYGSLEEWPSLILLPFSPAEKEALSRKLSKLKGRRVELRIPQRGKNKRLMDFASDNARMLIRKKKADIQPLEELKNVLDLPVIPNRIEGFDISNTMGEESVGSLVVFREGIPDKDRYRRYKIKSVEGPNDVASISEVLLRRYTRVLAEGESLPDLIFVDGGKPQLNTAAKTLKSLDLEEVPLVSLAKKEEIIFTPGHRNGLRLDRTSMSLKLLQSIRDEAHRFAITLHRKRREKRSFASQLDGIHGLGPRRKTRLLAQYKSLSAIRRASLADLSGLIGRPAAEALLRHLSAKKDRGNR